MTVLNAKEMKDKIRINRNKDVEIQWNSIKTKLNTMDLGIEFITYIYGVKIHEENEDSLKELGYKVYYVEQENKDMLKYAISCEEA